MGGVISVLRIFSKRVARVNMSADESVAIERFLAYLRCKTVQPKPDYDSAVKFLTAYADELGLPCKIYYPVEGKPVVVLTWEGEDASLKTVLLNSHIDVVPVFPEHWKYDPFVPTLEADTGLIYGRGSQDMKCLAIMYMEAIRRLKKSGFKPKRTVHLSFVPDEEIGGKDGMRAFAATEDFTRLNIGMGIDEGLASETEVCPVYHGERNQMWLKFTFMGNPGHGSRFIEGTAYERMLKFLNSVQSYRHVEEERL